jgi:shikimate kinase
MRPVFLTGFMGAGKTTVGRILAERTGMAFVDLDDEIVAAGGTSVAEIFASRGEAGFREAERVVLRSLAERKDIIVACGGGVVTDPASRSMLESAGTVVYLAVSPAEALARIGVETDSRPLLGRDSASALLASREPLYAATADHTIDTTGTSADEVAERVSHVLEVRRD